MESRYKRDHGYSYGEMIQKQDALTVSELTEGVFSETLRVGKRTSATFTNSFGAQGCY